MQPEIDHSEPIPNRNIILIGLMGCGKSTIGKRLSEMLYYPLVDTDEHIENLEKRKISEIFEKDGEDYFRKCEADLVRSLIDMGVHKHIIATGGGLPTRQPAQKSLRELGYVVWLSADVDTLHERTAHKNHRPLLQTENPKAVLTSLLDDREVHYKRCAHLKISTKDLDVDDIAHGILESARVYFSERLKHEDSM